MNDDNKNPKNNYTPFHKVESSTSTTSQFRRKSKALLKRKKSRPKLKIGCGWTDKYLFLGESYQDEPLNYTPIIHFPTKCGLLCPQVTQPRKTCRSDEQLLPCSCSNTDFCSTYTAHESNRFGCKPQVGCEHLLFFSKSRITILQEDEDDEDEEVNYNSVRTNRFGEGIEEKCETGLYFSNYSYDKKRRDTTKSRELYPDDNMVVRVDRFDIKDEQNQVLFENEDDGSSDSSDLSR